MGFRQHWAAVPLEKRGHLLDAFSLGRAERVHPSATELPCADEADYVAWPSHVPGGELWYVLVRDSLEDPDWEQWELQLAAATADAVAADRQRSPSVSRSRHDVCANGNAGPDTPCRQNSRAFFERSAKNPCVEPVRHACAGTRAHSPRRVCTGA